MSPKPDATDNDLAAIFRNEQRRDPCGDITDYSGTAQRAMRRAYDLGKADGETLAHVQSETPARPLSLLAMVEQLAHQPVK